MENKKVVKLAYWVQSLLFQIIANATNVHEKMIEVLSNIPDGRLLLALNMFLDKQTKKFDRTDLSVFTYKTPYNSSRFVTQIAGMVNRSVYDIVAKETNRYDLFEEIVDFTYPYRFTSYTFLTSKPQNKPHVFGIFQTFSSTVWMTIALVFIIMLFLSYIVFNRKYTFSQCFSHVLAVLMKQSALIKPSSYFENIIVYSWVFGTMFLCLAHDSVFLAFLSFPPVTLIKNVSDLTSAIKDEAYHCVSSPVYGLKNAFLESNDNFLKLLGLDLQTNNLSTLAYHNFFYLYKKRNLALIEDTRNLDVYNGKYFISEDRFMEWMPGMMVSKRFCCKNLLDAFVHRMMSSVLYFKYFSDAQFVTSLPVKLYDSEKDTSLRRLTLTDVAPAFILLLCGYCISISVFIKEIFVKWRKSRNSQKNN